MRPIRMYAREPDDIGGLDSTSAETLSFRPGGGFIGLHGMMQMIPLSFVLAIRIASGRNSTWPCAPLTMRTLNADAPPENGASQAFDESGYLNSRGGSTQPSVPMARSTVNAMQKGRNVLMVLLMRSNYTTKRRRASSHFHKCAFAYISDYTETPPLPR